MTTFLSALASKAAEKWLALLVLPGSAYVACLVTGLVLGHRDALNLPELQHAIDRSAHHPGTSSPGAILLVAVATLAAAALAGQLASALGAAVERLWTLPGDRGLARALTRRRQRRWLRADRQRIEAETRTALAHALARRDAVSREPPQRPTWIGDRFHSVDERVHRAYDLDLAPTWPRLWLVVPESVRAELGTARDAYGAAARTAGWAVLYLLLVVWWWPALPVAAVLATVAWVRGREAAAVLADLAEATVDLHGSLLARNLGLTGNRPELSRETGYRITVILRKDPTDQRSHPAPPPRRPPQPPPDG